MNRSYGVAFLTILAVSILMSVSLLKALGRSSTHRKAADVEISIGILPYGEAFSGQSGPRRLGFGAPEAHFDVIITNHSNGPLDFFAGATSWGDHTLTFSLTAPNGEKTEIKNATMAYSRNFPEVVRLQPGESWAREIPYGGRPYPGFEEAHKAYAGQTVKMQVELNQMGAHFKKDPYVWNGRVQSKEIEVLLDR